MNDNKDIITKNNVKYNIMVIEDILFFTKKKSSFGDYLISEPVRKRALTNGALDKSKIENIYQQTGIDYGYLQGKKRFFVEKMEVFLSKNPKLLESEDFITSSNSSLSYPKGLDKFGQYIENELDKYNRGEHLEDEGLERLIYYLDHDFSIEYYKRAKITGLSEIIKALDLLTFEMIEKEEPELIKNFIASANKKIILCKAANLIKAEKSLEPHKTKV